MNRISSYGVLAPDEKNHEKIFQFLYHNFVKNENFENKTIRASAPGYSTQCDTRIFMNRISSYGVLAPDRKIYEIYVFQP